MIKVLLVDDQALVRMAVRTLLAAERAIQIVADVGSGAEAIAVSRQLKPEVVVADVDMPEMSGIEVTRRIIMQPHRPKVIALSVHIKPPWPQRLLKAGALGYIDKERSESEIVEAIRTVHRGAPFVSSTLTGSLALARHTDPFQTLSNREMEIMTLLVKGKSPEAIAELLHVSSKTVYSHRDHHSHQTRRPERCRDDPFGDTLWHAGRATVH